MRTHRRTAARFAATGAALTLALGGLAACGEDEPEPAPAPGVEDDTGTDPGVGDAPGGTEPEGGGQVEGESGVGVGGAEDSG